jgi:serine protease Do
VIGINTAIASSSGGNEGIGFSIPSNLAQTVMEQLLEHGTVRRAYLGVRLDPQFDAKTASQLKLDRVRGARVTQVYPNTPASKANLLVDDVVLSFDGVDVQDENHLINLVSLTPIGRQVKLSVWRGGKRVQLTILLADRSEMQQTSQAPQPQPGMGYPVRLMGLTVHPLDGDLATQLGFQRSTRGLLILKVDPACELASELEVYDVLEAVGTISRGPWTRLRRRATSCCACTARGRLRVSRIWWSGSADSSHPLRCGKMQRFPEVSGLRLPSKSSSF